MSVFYLGRRTAHSRSMGFRSESEILDSGNAKGDEVGGNGGEGGAEAVEDGGDGHGGALRDARQESPMPDQSKRRG